MAKFLNISTDSTLGGNSPSDDKVSSEKAVKAYVDNKSVSLSNLSDVTITSALSGQALCYDGSKWANAPKSLVTFRVWS